MEPERCEECGFDATRLTIPDAITALRSLGRRWKEAFKDVPDEELRRRPEPLTWSPLEYAAHTRDVIGLVGSGMEQTLGKDGAEFPSIPPEEEGADHGYNRLDPVTVLRQLDESAQKVAVAAADARSGAWAHKATLGNETVSAEWFPKHIVHDATHHLRDVERQLKSS
jgi:hypothetical protein